MPNVKVRPDGYYLVKNGHSGELQIEYITGGWVWDSQLDNYKEIGDDDYDWVREESLNLESIKLIMMNGGLENAVEVVQKDSMYNIVS